LVARIITELAIILAIKFGVDVGMSAPTFPRPIFPGSPLMAEASQNDGVQKKPTGCLLGACSGQHPMGYRFSLLTLLFSGVFASIKPQAGMKFRLFL
jgi:hypothetical protein